MQARRRDRFGLRPAISPRWGRCSVVILAIAVMLSVLGLSSSVDAQRRRAPREAVEAYERAREHYAAGRYREAVTDLELALTHDPGSPTLMHNLARVYELLGETESAIAFYEQYRNALPARDAEERATTDETIERLRNVLARQAAPPPDPVPPPVVDTSAPSPNDRAPPRREAPTENGVADTPFWITVAIGGALGVAGAVTGLLALDRASKVDSYVLGGPTGMMERGALMDDADRYAMWCDIALAGAATAGIVAILLYTVREKPSSDRPRAFGSLTRDRLVLGIDGVF